MNKSKEHNLALLLISVFVSTYVLINLFYHSSFELIPSNNFLIGEATAKGVDVGLRVSLFYRVVLTGFVLIFLIFLTLNYLSKKFQVFDKDLNSYTLICVLGIGSVFCSAIGLKSDILSHFLIILFCLLLLKEILSRKLKKLIEVNCYALILGLSFLIYLGLLLLFGSNEWLVKNFLLVSVLHVLIITSLYYWAIGKITEQKINTILLPLIFIPFLTFISIELLLFIQLKTGSFVGYKVLFLSLGLTSNFLYYVLVFIKKLEVSSETFFKYFIAPALLFGFALLSFYQPIIPQSTEIFELANPANSVLNVFKFSEIPFLDFMSSHLLFEQWSGYLYSAIFGFNGQQDFLIYSFLNDVIFTYLLYYIFNKLFNNAVLSVVFIMCFPFVYAVFFPHLFIVLVLVFFMNRTIEFPSIKNFILLFSLLLIFCFWRLESGATAVLSTLLFMPILWLCYQKKFFLKPFFIGGLIFLIELGILLEIAFWLRSFDYVLANFKSALHYLSANQAHGFSKVANDYPHQFYVYHYIFPLIAVVSIFYLLFTFYQSNKKKEDLGVHKIYLISAAFLFVIYLVNAQRGLVRHSFLENREKFLVSTFFAAAALMIAFLSKRNKQHSTFIVFYAAAFLLFIFLKYFPYDESKTQFEQSITQNSFFKLDSLLNENNFKGRMTLDTAFAKENYLNLKDFLDQKLMPEQTFLDFSNTPMLYFYCQRKIPGYFNQNLQNTVDEYLQLELLKTINPKDVPVIVYSSYPKSWFDATDGIPNPVRYHLIAEYIYQNYKPFGIINNKNIWIAKNLNWPKDSTYEKSLNEPIVIYPYGFLAGYMAEFKLQKVKNIQPLYKYSGDLKNLGDTIRFDLSQNISSTTSCYLSIEFETNELLNDTLPVEVFVHDSNWKLTGGFTFDYKKFKSSTFFLQLSSHPLWFSPEFKRITIYKKNTCRIKQISILKD